MWMAVLSMLPFADVMIDCQIFDSTMVCNDDDTVHTAEIRTCSG